MLLSHQLTEDIENNEARIKTYGLVLMAAGVSYLLGVQDFGGEDTVEFSLQNVVGIIKALTNKAADDYSVPIEMFVEATDTISTNWNVVQDMLSQM